MTTDKNSLTQRSTVLTLAIACGSAVANVYYNQPLLADMERVYNLVPNAESRLNTVYMVINYTGGALGYFLSTYTWGLWQWKGVCALGFFLLAVAFIAHFSVRNRKSPAV
ncbi:hypothetical protein [Nostoc sp.]|uniref:hypothetical protein n=1 Tax=Nostoc sp. TaxID=1180 RepID=UPI002FF5D52B